eukprot:5436279-Prymnesium_polylepis.1
MEVEPHRSDSPRSSRLGSGLFSWFWEAMGHAAKLSVPSAHVKVVDHGAIEDGTLLLVEPILWMHSNDLVEAGVAFIVALPLVHCHAHHWDPKVLRVGHKTRQSANQRDDNRALQVHGAVWAGRGGWRVADHHCDDSRHVHILPRLQIVDEVAHGLDKLPRTGGKLLRCGCMVMILAKMGKH